MTSSVDTHRRSLAKAVSWRVLGTSITATIAWALTSRWSFAVSLGLIDLVGKIGAYYLHERLWERIPFGRGRPPEYNI